MVASEFTQGSMEMSNPERMILAEKSLAWNFKENNVNFVKHFGDFFK
jgi:hypothetical protein